MQDKMPKDWNADAQFWADAWDDMETRLDAAMPVRKRRFILPFWLLGLALSLVVLAWLAFAASDNSANDVAGKTITQTEQPKISTTITAAELKCEDHSEKTTGKDQQSTVEAGKTLELVTAPITAKSSLDKNFDNKTLTPNPAVKAEREGQMPIESTAVVAPKVNTATSRNKAVVVDFIPARTSLLAVDADLDVSGLTERVSSEKAVITRNKPRFNGVLYAGGSFGRPTARLGYFGGLGLERTLGEKGRLTASIGFNDYQEAISFGGTNTTNDESVIIPVTGDSSEFSNVDFLSVGTRDDSYLKIQSLRLGLMYSRSIGKRFSLGAGIGVNWLMNTKLSLMQVNSISLSRGEGLLDIGPGNNAAPENFPADLSFDKYLGLRRFRYDATLEANYHLNKRLFIGAGVKTFLSPALNPSNFTSGRLRGTVKVGYRF